MAERAWAQVLDELIVRQLPMAISSIQFKQGPGDAVNIAQELGSIKTRLEQGAFRAPFDLHSEVAAAPGAR